MRDRTTHHVGVAAAVAYLAAVVAFELLRRGAHGPQAADLASSPAGVASGHLLPLLTSGLLVAGDPVVQIAGAAAAAIAVLVLLGPGAFWRAALAGHVGATLVAYAGVGLLWLVARADVDAVVDAPDYGISAVWAGSLGALVVAGTRGSSRRLVRGVAVAAVALFVAAIPFSSDLAGVEHLLAFVLGGIFAVGARARGGQTKGGPEPAAAG